MIRVMSEIYDSIMDLNGRSFYGLENEYVCSYQQHGYHHKEIANDLSIVIDYMHIFIWCVHAYACSLMADMLSFGIWHHFCMKM